MDEKILFSDHAHSGHWDASERSAMPFVASRDRPVEKGWNFTKKFLDLTKYSLTAEQNGHGKFLELTSNVMSALKISSIADVPLGVLALYYEGQEIRESISLKDIEGAARSSVGATIAIGGAAMGAATFTAGVLEVAALHAIQGLSVFIAPLGLGVSGLGMGIGLYDLRHIAQLRRELDQEPIWHWPFQEENVSAIESAARKFVAKHLGGVAQPEHLDKLHRRKERALARISSPIIVNQLKALQACLDKGTLSSAQAQDVLLLIQNIQTVSRRAMERSILGIMVGLIGLFGLLLLVTTSSPLSYMILLMATTFRIGMMFQNESPQDEGLFNIEFS